MTQYEKMVAVCDMMVAQGKATTRAEAFDRLAGGEKVTLDFTVRADTAEWRGLYGSAE